MRSFSPLRAADPAEPTGGSKPEETPATPKVVAKTPIKTPREISLEKELAKVQDDLAGLKTWQGEVNAFMGETFPQGKPVKVPVKQAKPGELAPAATPAAAPRHEVDAFLFGKA